MTHLAVSDEIPVYPNVKARVHTFKDKISVFSIHIIDVKVPHIYARRIVIGNKRRVARKRIVHISIMRLIITVHLPIGWYNQVIPAGGVIVIPVESVFDIIHGIMILEFP
ncbi:hypothetical protein ES708_03845 [subsurface metagenome]